MDINTQKTPPGESSPPGSGYKTLPRKPFKWAINHVLLLQSITSLGLALSLSLLWMFSSSAQGSLATIRQLRAMQADETGLQNPAGLTFSSRARAFHVLEKPGQSLPVVTEVIKLTPFGRRTGSTWIAAQVENPINMAFDNKFHRLLILQFPGNQLLEVNENLDGNLDPTTLARFAASRFGLQNPQGLAVDPESGSLFILDAVGPRIVRVEPGLDGSFDEATISTVNLKANRLAAARGLAFDPATRHLHLVSPAEQELVELTLTGQVVAYRDLSGFHISNPQGMVFAPSGDQTDDPAEMSLYLADKSLVNGEILEFSLSQPALRAAAAASAFTSALVKTTDTAVFSPPSPDPDGLVYLPLSNNLLMSDSEVEETVNGITHFASANLWDLTLDGSVVSTANISYEAPTVKPMTDEPTGVTWDSANGHYFFSDDNACQVYELKPGADKQFFTADDTFTNFSTKIGGICDTEDITYDKRHDRLFVADGNNREIYQYTTTGSLVSHFDVAAYGVVDPEGVVFNSDSGTLFVLSNSGNRVIIETAITGELLQTINVSANGAVAPAGLAYAPASDGSGSYHFYIVDRGIDNNTDPNIIDGKMYEMSAPVRKSTATTITSNLSAPSVVGEPVMVQYSVVVTAPGGGMATGNVIVSDGNQSCTGTVAEAGCAIAFTTRGTKTLTATYAGDTNFNSSSSDPATTHTVNPANTTTVMASDLPDPSVVGQAVKISYNVSAVAPGGGTPTGSVLVSAGSQSCTGTVAEAGCSITFTTPGVKTLTATYAGETNFNGSASTLAANHTVNPANTTTAILSDLSDPSTLGQAVTIHFSVEVTLPGSGTPTGNVTVTDGTQICNGSVAAGSCSIIFTTAGTKILTATYAGDNNFLASTSASQSHVVRAATTTAITSDQPDPSAVGQPVTFNYQVAVTPPGNGTPSGSVVVSDGAQSCFGSVAAGSCSITFTTAGIKTLTATYVGDANFITSTSMNVSHVVDPAGTTTIISSDLPDPSAVGQAYLVTFIVIPVTGGTPTGNVTVSDGIDSCVGTVASGMCTLTSTTFGAKSLIATYAGDGNYSGSISSPVPHIVPSWFFLPLVVR